MRIKGKYIRNGEDITEAEIELTPEELADQLPEGYQLCKMGKYFVEPQPPKECKPEVKFGNTCPECHLQYGICRCKPECKPENSFDMKVEADDKGKIKYPFYIGITKITDLGIYEIYGHKWWILRSKDEPKFERIDELDLKDLWATKLEREGILVVTKENDSIGKLVDKINELCKVVNGIKAVNEVRGCQE
jgi:hypothetical protein